MRSMRRGIKEMDLLLVAYSAAQLSGMDDATLDLYDRLLHENDQDLYAWVTGRVPAPVEYGAMVAEISRAISDA
ncbi:succinate dehydrogenase assembly factor 2 [Mesobacterium pallidum]|uniref:succinate dehydrogenase assembly factor 2 n=1 Tax=Mesobacterium pallidum TaxID=2872037 RepID=UPI001EE374F1|nr:succinate dehydrogenase assembly factor 2 [Mesobacterium pallidum]